MNAMPLPLKLSPGRLNLLPRWNLDQFLLYYAAYPAGTQDINTKLRRALPSLKRKERKISLTLQILISFKFTILKPTKIHVVHTVHVYGFGQALKLRF